MLTQDMIGLNSVLASWISGKPYILGGLFVSMSVYDPVSVSGGLSGP